MTKAREQSRKGDHIGQEEKHRGGSRNEEANHEEDDDHVGPCPECGERAWRFCCSIDRFFREGGGA